MTARVLLDRIDDWLVAQATGNHDISAIVEGCAKRLAAAGIPVARMHVSYRTLHPLFASQSVTWSREHGLVLQDNAHAELAHSGWLGSPLQYMVENDLETLRRHLAGPAAVLDFPILEGFAAEGLTDYLAFAVPFDQTQGPGDARDGMVGSWTTDRAEGFNDDELALLLHVQTRLALACKVQIKAQITRHILTTYLGNDAGKRVLNGQIRRGDFDPIRAVIWYSDMRRSTMLAEQLSGSEFMTALDDYFECSAGAVVANGGEVLRFVGDAVLAIFPIHDDNEAASAALAVAGARDAVHRLEQCNTRRRTEDKVEIDFGMALHLGEVMFGNIGIPQRLEFSVIGPAANLVARLEDLTKELKCRVLLSHTVARVLDDDFKPGGEHDLRGVAEPVSVYVLSAGPLSTATGRAPVSPAL
jgi:adenylate cyclase